MNPDVSILISVFNGEKTLNRCFESIFNQTFRDYRIVCINDCSTDSTLKILRLWQDRFPKGTLQIFSNKKNLGLTKSLNKGLQFINTDYTARIDSDDWWDSQKLRKQISLMKKNSDLGIIGCNYKNIGFGKEKNIILFENDDDIKKHIIKRNPFAHSCVIFKTPLVKNIGGYDENIKYGQDYELWLRCYPLTKFHNIQECLCFRSVERGISVEKQRQQMIQGIKTQIKYIRKYQLNKINYFFIFELLMLIITPDFIKKIKRNCLQ